MVRRNYVLAALVLMTMAGFCSCSKNSGKDEEGPTQQGSGKEKTASKGGAVAESNIDTRPSDFRSLTWGMTRKEVKANLEDAVVAKEGKSNILCKAKASGHDVQLILWFDKGGLLYQGEYAAYGDNDLSFFTAARSGLLELFGNFVSEDRARRSKTQSLKWVTPRSTILLEMFDKGRGRSFNTVLTYTSSVPVDKAGAEQVKKSTQGL